MASSSVKPATDSWIRFFATSWPASSTRATSWWPSAQSIPQNTLNLLTSVVLVPLEVVRNLTRTRGALMTKLCGLTSDEPFAIPAIRTAPVFA